MNAKTFRCLVLFCCTAAAGLVTIGTCRYVAQKSFVDAVNTREHIAQFGSVQFRAPEVTSSSFYIAGLFLALGGCFWLKAAREEAISSDSRETVDDSSLSE
jgi:hypothetical protein